MASTLAMYHSGLFHYPYLLVLQQDLLTPAKNELIWSDAEHAAKTRVSRFAALAPIDLVGQPVDLPTAPALVHNSYDNTTTRVARVWLVATGIIYLQHNEFSYITTFDGAIFRSLSSNYDADIARYAGRRTAGVTRIAGPCGLVDTVRVTFE